ncbi:hypothetical protein D9M71_818950 [compost metagenome]
MHRAGGDHRGDDASGGLHIDFRDHRAFDDLLDRAFELIAYVDRLDGHALLPRPGVHCRAVLEVQSAPGQIKLKRINTYEYRTKRNIKIVI